VTAYARITLPEPGQRVAAVDVGSNALRLLFMQVLEEQEGPVFRKVSLMRMPLRLGTEAFTRHRLSRPTTDRLVQSLAAFRLLLRAWQPVAWKACATSALRSIANQDEVLERIRAEAGMRLEVVSGPREAELLLRNQPQDWHPESEAYLYVDVGGGSTELTLLREGRIVSSGSWPLGTVRLLAGQEEPGVRGEMARWLAQVCGGLSPVCVGSGGNINKLASLLRQDETQPLARDQFRRMLAKVEPLSLPERVVKLGLRPDRADVFPHALRIYLECMEASGAQVMLVPRMGLADALVREAWLQREARREARPRRAG